jgi:hypothetical protein
VHVQQQEEEEQLRGVQGDGVQRMMVFHLGELRPRPS